jgi:hypothetical protein
VAVIEQLLTQPVRIHRISRGSVYGEGVAGSEISVHDTVGYLDSGTAQAGLEETIGRQDTALNIEVLFLLNTETPRTGDRAEVESTLFEILDIRHPRRPNSSPHHVECRVRLLPSTSITVLRAAGLDAWDGWGAPPTPTPIVTGVPAIIVPLSGTSEIVAGEREDVEFRLDAAPCDIRFTDTVELEQTGELYRVVWVREAAIGAHHVEARLRQVTGNA